MIVNIRGTNGSGKSHLVKTVMSFYPIREPQLIPNRKQPVAYVLRHSDRMKVPLWVPGHYEIDCGGCDTLPSIPDSYTVIRKGVDAGLDCIYEGLVVESDVTRCVALAKEKPLTVIMLATSLDDCIEAVRARRVARAEAKGVEPKPLDPKNVILKYKSLRNQGQRFRDAGVRFLELHRQEALEMTRSLLQV